MQLFLLDHIDIKGNDVTIDNPELWQQAKKVLRLSSGDQMFVQVGNTRYELEILALQNFKILSRVKNILHAPKNDRQVTMIIAMPNKREKAELIVQKLTEIGVNEIIFRPSERSIIKTWNENKAARLEKIAKEALEQSRGWNLPMVTFVTDVHERLQNNKLIVFDMDGKMETLKNGNMKEGLDRLSTGGLYGLIGPEGGRGDKDYELFKKYTIETISLGATVLRMETAAIVGAWVMKNGL